MNKVKLVLTNRKQLNKKFYNIVLVDNKKIKGKYQGKDYVYSFETTEQAMNVKILTVSQVQSKLWYVMSIFYFIISVFGIFDVRPSRKCKTLKFDCGFELQENSTVVLGFNNFAENIPAVTINTNCEFQPIENKYFIDQASKKKIKTAGWLKFGTFLILLAVFIVLMVTLL